MTPQETCMLAALALSGAGCLETRVERVPAAPGDLIVTAAVSPEGRVLESAIAVAPRAPAMISVGSAERFDVWVIAAAQLAGSNGAPLDPAMLEGARVQAADAPPRAGSCGRCLFPTADPPQPVSAGDRCVLPLFARLFRGGAEITQERDRDAARQALVLDWPGDCTCPMVQVPENIPNYEYTLADPVPFEPVERVAVAADGTIAVFAERASRIVDAQGAVLAEREAADGLFTGAVLAASGMQASLFAAVSHSSGAALDAELQIIARDLGVRVSRRNLSLRPENSRFLEEEGLLLLLGQGEGRVPAAEACRFEDDALRCTGLIAPSLAVIGETVLEATRMPDGALVLYGSKGIVVFDRVPDPAEGATPAISAHSAGEASGSLGTASWRAFGMRFGSDEARPRSAGHAGDRAIACTFDGGAYAVSAAIDATMAAPAGSSPRFETVLAQPGHACAGTAREAAGLRILFDGEVSAIVGSDGALVSMESNYLLPGSARRPLGIDSPNSSWTVALGPAGDVHLRDDRAPDPVFAAVYGPSRASGAPVADILALGDHFLAFSSSGEVRVVSSAGSLLRSASLGGLPAGFIVDAVAVFDDATLVIAAYGPEPRRTQFFRAGVEALVLSPLSPSLEDARVRSIAALSPGRLALIAEGGKIDLLAEDRLVEVAIDWDDPSTPEVESAPPYDTDCLAHALDPARPERDLWRDLDAADGAAWAVGCRGALVRIHAAASPPRATRVSVGRATQTHYLAGVDHPPPLHAVRAVCPDLVYFASAGRDSVDFERGRTWRIAPLSGGTVFGALELKDAPDLPTAGSRLSSGAPLDLVGREVIHALFGRGPGSGGSLQELGIADRVRIGDGFTRGAALQDGTVLAGTDAGRLYLGKAR